MTIRSRLAPAGALLLLAGCTGEEPTATDSPGSFASPTLSQLAGSTPDLGGSWNWTREAHLSFPDWLAPAFGIDPEGPTMTAQCVVSGTMTVVQNGNTFTGDLTATGGGCVTKGGQPFPGMMGPPDPISGRIAGKSVHFSTDGFLLDCLLHAVVTDHQAGVATALQGGGHCIVPGHPKSDLPGFKPPPSGTEVFLSWTAERP